MKRRAFITLLGGAVAAPVIGPLAARAQQVRKVGWLYPGPARVAPARIAPFLEGLRAGGFRSPEDVELLARIADGDNARLAPLARDLIERKVDVILAASPPAIHAAVPAARAAGATMPIVAMSFETDPVGSGLVKSLAKPGGNVTGLFLDFPEFSKKWLELLKELMPDLKRVAVMWDPATGDMQIDGVRRAAKILNVELDTVEVRARPELEGAFAAAARGGANAVVMVGSPVFGGNVKLMAELALKHRLPAVTIFTQFPRVGGLMAYGPNLFDAFRQAGGIVARVLQGRKPADIPVELYSRFELVVNLKTAKALGLTVPTSILIRADEVIE